MDHWAVHRVEDITGRPMFLQVAMIRRAPTSNGTKEVKVSLSQLGDPFGKFWMWTLSWTNWSSGARSNKTARDAANPHPRTDHALSTEETESGNMLGPERIGNRSAWWRFMRTSSATRQRATAPSSQKAGPASRGVADSKVVQRLCCVVTPGPFRGLSLATRAVIGSAVAPPILTHLGLMAWVLNRTWG